MPSDEDRAREAWPVAKSQNSFSDVDRLPFKVGFLAGRASEVELKSAAQRLLFTFADHEGRCRICDESAEILRRALNPEQTND